MDYQKEQTYNPRKTITDCPQCRTNELCSSCQGPCIFSKIYFKKCKDNKKLRSNLKEKHYKKQFDLLRNLVPEETLENAFNIEESEEYTLLKILYENSKDYWSLLKKHQTEYDLPSKEGRYRLNMKNYSVNGRCRWHKQVNIGKRFDNESTRQGKKQWLVNEGSDFIFE